MDATKCATLATVHQQSEKALGYKRNRRLPGTRHHKSLPNRPRKTPVRDRHGDPTTPRRAGRRCRSWASRDPRPGCSDFRHLLSRQPQPFFYTEFLGAVFVGFLVFIGGFLIAYTGDIDFEDYGSTAAGIGACFVALFPITGSGCEPDSSFTARPFLTVAQGTPPTVPETTSEEFVRGHSTFRHAIGDPEFPRRRTAITSLWR